MQWYREVGFGESICTWSVWRVTWNLVKRIHTLPSARVQRARALGILGLGRGSRGCWEKRNTSARQAKSENITCMCPECTSCEASRPPSPFPHRTGGRTTAKGKEARTEMAKLSG
jgi:hypothetical protein